MLNRQQIFQSKRGIFIYIPPVIMLAAVVAYIWYGQYFPALFMLIILAALVAPIFFNTWYGVSNDTLTVKCGLFFNTTIQVNTIRKISDTRSLLSAPALSMDRIEIFYNKYDSVVVSPLNKPEFIALLQSINPSIEYPNKHA